ncbi:cation:proton antiporter domain-containing protein [Olivibacter domesticus]|uniref:Monovalent cation:H+ antiporter-2, CPA2 family n=1 Tax=Olivibacter domesticus TaxID=407022 RepID=A0A1H7WMR1_OLID1|nr:cation:proton antiporter [Olivibacter domesticus]SEM22415.1 monovalent cation:H+ antiporter-2, CPA2 family [Olivibacter domesticus]
MAHLPELIQDMALILLVGALVTILFKRIKQPLVLGYIIAGFLVGPHFSYLPTIADHENVETFAEIGVIMLLFSLGLEFSFKKLVKVGGPASITAVTEIIFVGLGGYLTGYLLGWSQMDSLFLAGMLASSSTTIILRAFDELGLKPKQFAKVVFGVLVVEDIIVILLMVLLSTVAVTQTFHGSEILFTVLKLGFFLVLWFLVGIYLLPVFIKKTKKWMDEETVLILAIGLCFGMVLLATQVGFSAELGAFVMGSLIAETVLAEKIEHLTQPIKQFFGTIFFVSVGMMIDPQAMYRYAGPILAITLLTIVGKFFFSGLGALISGQPLKQAVQIGSSMAQIGEFAFIVAALGLSLGVISEFLFPIAVGVSAITTFTTPYLIKFSEPLYSRIVNILPAKWVARLDVYTSETQKNKDNPLWKKMLQEYNSILITNSIILVAIALLFKYTFIPFLNTQIESVLWRNVVLISAATLLASPFLWAILIKKVKLKEGNDATNSYYLNYSVTGISLHAVRYLLGIFLIGFFIDQITTTKYALMVAVPVIVALLWLFSDKVQQIHQRIEQRFISNLNERERLAYIQNKGSIELQHKNEEAKKHFQEWNAYVTELEAVDTILFAGMTLYELNWKEQYGIHIVYIRRNDRTIHLPNGKQRILPSDKVGVLGTDEQISRLKVVFDQTVRQADNEEDIDINDIQLIKVQVTEASPYSGKTIKTSGIRKDLRSQVVGIERAGNRMLNPGSSETIFANDIVWLVGDTHRIKACLENHQENFIEV